MAILRVKQTGCRLCTWDTNEPVLQLLALFLSTIPFRFELLDLPYTLELFWFKHIDLSGLLGLSLHKIAQSEHMA